jgi:hypothetical protein
MRTVPKLSYWKANMNEETEGGLRPSAILSEWLEGLKGIPVNFGLRRQVLPYVVDNLSTEKSRGGWQAPQLPPRTSSRRSW